MAAPDQGQLLRSAALAQPHAQERASGMIKFACPACVAEGHDQHQDNAAFFEDTGKWGCAFATDTSLGRTHWEAIGQALGAFTARNGHASPAKPVEPVGGAPAGGGRHAIIVAAASVTPEAITWIDPGRLAVGALTMAVGLPDQGKTLIACDLAARLSSGMPLPPAGRYPDAVARRRTVILTNEDTIATTMVPRLIAADADLTQINFIQMVRDADGAVSLLTLEKDLDALEAAIETTGPALVVIDGLAGYLGNVKSHNDADVRRVLSPFAAVLGRTGTAGLGLMHPPKVTTNLHYYAGGSVAFTAVPRVVLGVAPDPEDEHDNPRRFVAKLKGNLYGRVPTLAYRITAPTEAAVPHLEWEPEPVSVNIADVFAPPHESSEDRGSRHECETWLRHILADGPKPATEMETAAEAAGFKRHTLRRAKERVCDSVKDGSRWVWFLLPTETARP
jgi:putative DNA primase/helicase